MKSKFLGRCFGVFFSLGLGCISAPADPAKPNLLIIYADDMGFGDVQAYGNLFGTSSTVPTPNMNQLAAEGMIFTQAHSCSAVCTPSRYGIITGRYSWRLAGDGILPSGIVGLYGNPIIRQGETTIAQFLKEQGYATAAFGKWHLGAQYYDRAGNPFTGNQTNVSSINDINLHRIEGHAVHRGFDYFFGAAETINRPPYAYMRNDKLLYNGEIPEEGTHPWSWLSSLGSESPNGLGDPNIPQIDYSPDLIDEAEAWITARASTPEQPFFAYVSLYSPHTPHLPTPAFQGSVGFTYGDYLHETDHWIGRIIDAVDNNPALSNTIIVITSDNGPETHAYTESRSNGHDANGPLKGVKRDSWEGGTRVPFIVRWPGHISPGSTSNSLVWQGDIYSTIAAVLGVPLKPNESPDGESFLPVLQDKAKPSNSRDSIIIASVDNQLSIKTADGWKLIDGTGGGGNATSYSSTNTNISNAKGTIGGSPKQLFNLNTDIGETTNLEASETSIRDALLTRLAEYRGTPTSHRYSRSTQTISLLSESVLVGEQDTDRSTAPLAPGKGWYTGSSAGEVRQRDSSNTEWRTQWYFRFDNLVLAPFAGDKILSASLHVPQIGRLNTQSTSNSLRFHDVNTHWDLSSGTAYPVWNLGRETPTGSGILLEDFGSSSYQQFGTTADTSNPDVEGTFTSNNLGGTVQKWIDDPADNHGILVTMINTGLSGLAFDAPSLDITTGSVITPFIAWTQDHGLDGSTGKESGATDDPDKDGANNMLEWMRGTDPLNPDASPVIPMSNQDDGSFSLTFTRNPQAAAHISLFVDWGDAPGNFTQSMRIGGASVIGGTDSPSISIDSPAEGKVTFTLPASMVTGDKLFARLRITLP